MSDYDHNTLLLWHLVWQAMLVACRTMVIICSCKFVSNYTMLCFVTFLYYAFVKWYWATHVQPSMAKRVATATFNTMLHTCWHSVISMWMIPYVHIHVQVCSYIDNYILTMKLILCYNSSWNFHAFILSVGRTQLHEFSWDWTRHHCIVGQEFNHLNSCGFLRSAPRHGNQSLHYY